MACLAGVLILRRHVHVRLAVLSLLLAALLSAAMALLQYAGLAAALAPWVWPVGPGEGFANLRQRNQFGSLSAMGLACLLGWLATRTRLQPPALPTTVAAAAMALLAAGNAVSQSRTGLLAWLAVAAAAAWFCARQRRRGLGLAVVAAAVPLALASAMLLACQGSGRVCGAVARLADAGQDSRIMLWRNVLQLIAERPWTGWGWGELDFAHFITLFPDGRFAEKLGNAHNLPLHLAVELGVPAAMLLCLVPLVLVWRSQPWRERDAWRAVAWAVLGVIGLHSLLEYPLWYGPFQVTALLCAAHLWRTRAGPPGSARGHSGGRALDGAALAIGLMVVALSLDYWRVSQPFLAPAQRSAWLPGDPLQQARRSWWYRAHADFATLALTPLDTANAAELHALALRLLHHSPEPLVIDKLLDSSRLLGRPQDLAFYASRYQAAYPQPYAAWRARQPAGSPGP